MIAMTSRMNGTAIRSLGRGKTRVHRSDDTLCNPSSQRLIIPSQDIRLLGLAKHGIYDEVDEVDPVVLEHYYGAEESGDSEGPSDLDSNPDEESDPDDNTNSDSSLVLDAGSESDDSQMHVNPDPPDSSDLECSSDPEDDPDSEDRSHPPSRSDAEFSADGSDNCVDVEASDMRYGSWAYIAEIIAKAQGRNIRHDAAQVASSDSPFISRDEGSAFVFALERALGSDSYPEGFDLDDEYEPSESYRTGRSTRLLSIPLPYEVWFPRIVVWCKALDTLKQTEVARESCYD
jgi:hypothetical protein